MTKFYAHFFALISPIMASISQVIIKWQTNKVGELPAEINDRVWFVIEILMRPWVLFALLLTFCSGVSWIIAMTKLDLSYAYPYVASTFIIIPLLAMTFLGESLTAGKVIGIILILFGIFIVMTKG